MLQPTITKLDSIEIGAVWDKHSDVREPYLEELPQVDNGKFHEREEPQKLVDLSADNEPRSAMDCIFKALFDSHKKRDKKHRIKNSDLLKLGEVVELPATEDKKRDKDYKTFEVVKVDPKDRQKQRSTNVSGFGVMCFCRGENETEEVKLIRRTSQRERRGPRTKILSFCRVRQCM